MFVKSFLRKNDVDTEELKAGSGDAGREEDLVPRFRMVRGKEFTGGVYRGDPGGRIATPQNWKAGYVIGAEVFSRPTARSEVR